MTNHVYLLLTPGKAELVPKLVISLGPRYVQHINRTLAGAPAHCGTAAINPHWYRRKLTC